MAANPLIATLGDVDEAALLGLARIADRMLATPDGFRPGPWQSERRAGAGQEFLDLQPHVPGGDVRRVDWRASARGTRLLERRQRDATSGEWCVCLDRSASMGGAGSPGARLALQLSAAFAYLLLHREHAVACMTFSSRVNQRCLTGRGRAQYARLLRTLAGEVPGGRDGGETRLDACVGFVARRQSVVVVSDFLAGDAMRGGLARLLRRGGRVQVLQVLHADGDIVRGPARVQDLESGRSVQVADARAAADRARDRLARQRESLEAWCQRNRVAYSACRAGESWRDVLLGHLGRARRVDA